MQLTLREVAKYLRVSERTVYRWIDQKSIPVYRINDQYRFDRYELLDWVSARKIPVQQDFFNTPESQLTPLSSLVEAVKAGGIFYRLSGDDKETIIRQMVDLMPVPANVDKGFVAQILLNREKAASTGIGEGFAIPHVRNPVVLDIATPTVAICFLEKPVEYGALDGVPVHCLFGLVSPTVRSHLHLMSRISFVLRDQRLRECLSVPESRETILRELERVESLLVDSKARDAASNSEVDRQT